jgi:hypothetical protein
MHATSNMLFAHTRTNKYEFQLRFHPLNWIICAYIKIETHKNFWLSLGLVSHDFSKQSQGHQMKQSVSGHKGLGYLLFFMIRFCMGLLWVDRIVTTIGWMIEPTIR